MQSIALISGLIGALISAGLSYWIRASLDRRNLRDAEKRLAYVHFVRISELVAIDVVLRSFIKVYVTEDMVKELAAKDGTFEPSHKISVIIAKEIQKLTPEKLEEVPGLSMVPVFLKSQLEALSESKLSAEQLSKLPRETVLTYSLFLNYLSHLRGVVLLWTFFFEEKKATWATPESIHDQWLSVTKFFEQARILRSALLSTGAATPAEASALLQKQVSTYNESILAKFRHQPKLQAAISEANAIADATKV
jgi:hypothetical protein